MVSAITLKRPLRRPALVLFAALLTWFCTVFLSAPAALAEDKTAARDHWERGTKFYDLGKYDDAIREFEAAYEAKGDPAFLYNLAQSHRLAGHAAESLRFYRTYLRYVPKAPNRSDIEDRIKELEKYVKEHPAAETAAPSSPPNIPATAPPPNVPTPTPPAAGSGGGITGTPSTEPGAPGTAGAATTGTAGIASPPQLTSGPEGATAPPPYAPTGAPPAARKWSGRRIAGAAIAGGGGGLMVVGGIFGLVARNQAKKVETAASRGDRFDPAVESLGKTAQTLQWIGYGLGAAAVVTGLVLYVTAPVQEETQPPPRVTVAPLAVPGSGGALSLHVTF
jgi:tetratricopeptide (TPR) repeat protein